MGQFDPTCYDVSLLHGGGRRAKRPATTHGVAFGFWCALSAHKLNRQRSVRCVSCVRYSADATSVDATWAMSFKRCANSTSSDSFQFEYARGCRSIRGPKGLGQGPGNTIIRVRYFLGTFVSSSIWILFFGSTYLHGRLKLIIVATVTHFLLKTQSCNHCVA